MGKTSEIRGDRFETVNRRIARLMAAMMRRHVAGYGIPTIYLVGGTPCLPGIEEVVKEEVGAASLPRWRL